MNYYSTNNKNLRVTFKEAVLKGLASDGGLFMPEIIPTLDRDFLDNLETLSFTQIAYNISKKFIEDEIEDSHLLRIIENAINFEAPLVNLDDNLMVLELFHGPTLAFKDYGARFMAGTFFYFNKDNEQELIILVATSGDTGSAVANGFYEVPGIKVVILYPSGKVSNIQEKQLTTLGKNIVALEVEGTFDDCQKFVKQAFNDREINNKLKLSSANSINIARLIPQAFYYVNALKQLGSSKKKVVFSVPSGNFGNLTAGLLVDKMGFEIEKFIAAVNCNNAFTQYLETEKFEPKPSIKTLSNAMDVGNPSNFARILDLYNHKHYEIKNKINSVSLSDDKTLSAIREVYKNYNYLIDPHGAVGYLAAKNFLETTVDDYRVIILETAHPGKFPETVENALEIKIEIPEQLKKCLSLEKCSTKIPADYEQAKEFLLSL